MFGASFRPAQAAPLSLREGSFFQEEEPKKKDPILVTLLQTTPLMMVKAELHLESICESLCKTGKSFEALITAGRVDIRVWCGRQVAAEVASTDRLQLNPEMHVLPLCLKPTDPSQSCLGVQKMLREKSDFQGKDHLLQRIHRKQTEKRVLGGEWVSRNKSTYLQGEADTSASSMSAEGGSCTLKMLRWFTEKFCETSGNVMGNCSRLERRGFPGSHPHSGHETQYSVNTETICSCNFPRWGWLLAVVFPGNLGTLRSSVTLASSQREQTQSIHSALAKCDVREQDFCLLWQTAALKFYEEERDFKTHRCTCGFLTPSKKITSKETERRRNRRRLHFKRKEVKDYHPEDIYAITVCTGGFLHTSPQPRVDSLWVRTRYQLGDVMGAGRVRKATAFWTNDSGYFFGISDTFKIPPKVSHRNPVPLAISRRKPSPIFQIPLLPSDERQVQLDKLVSTFKTVGSRGP
ncbi:hypothetical protein E5288_WYG012132 [Bos mutus]|uniref:Uncharacterized protein n=1 Tax=Bos mutus TaxID=72004 RepID=A0A6B0R6S3_9CETA|nr:hypothetical protein [Bos mutus]